MTTTPLLHPINEACDLAGIGRTTLYEEAKKDRILIVKVGNKSLVPHSSLEAYRDLLVAEAEARRQSHLAVSPQVSCADRSPALREVITSGAIDAGGVGAVKAEREGGPGNRRGRAAKRGNAKRRADR